jgi:hypothetical protein
MAMAGAAASDCSDMDETGKEHTAERIFAQDFACLLGPDGNTFTSDRTLSYMHVESMSFHGPNHEYLEVHFRKESEMTIAVPWKYPRFLKPLHHKSDQLWHSVLILPDTTVSISPSTSTMHRLALEYPLHIKLENHERARYSEIFLTVYFRGKAVWSNESWTEEFCRSSNGLLLGAVTNWEDGDQREDPTLVVYNLLPLLTSLDMEHRKPFRTFLALLRQRRNQGTELCGEDGSPLTNAMIKCLLDIEELQNIILMAL